LGWGTASCLASGRRWLPQGTATRHPLGRAACSAATMAAPAGGSLSSQQPQQLEDPAHAYKLQLWCERTPRQLPPWMHLLDSSPCVGPNKPSLLSQPSLLPLLPLLSQPLLLPVLVLVVVAVMVMGASPAAWQVLVSWVGSHPISVTTTCRGSWRCRSHGSASRLSPVALHLTGRRQHPRLCPCPCPDQLPPLPFLPAAGGDTAGCPAVVAVLRLQMPHPPSLLGSGRCRQPWQQQQAPLLWAPRPHSTA
jgi:hypothetical protein